ncbi:unnamed protein product [Aphanomyces euteiches]
MDRPGMPTQKEARRLAEIIRKRKYRASKRSELIELESQARRLTAYLSEQKRAIRARQLARAKEETLSLQTQVSQYHCLTQIFSQWVHVNEHPQKVCPSLLQLYSLATCRTFPTDQLGSNQHYSRIRSPGDKEFSG